MTPENFWEQDNGKRDQKFYVAFCLLESALGDYAVAGDLHRHNKLNWASTAYYYSMVHALRLLCFAVTGDFPTGHADLAQLYKNGEIRISSRNSERKRWLLQFLTSQGTTTQIEHHVKFRRNEIASDFVGNGETLTTLNNKFKKWGNILDEARKCRNDSNYEGLIIAHEHAHQLITHDLNKLANVFRKLCEDIFPKVVLLFKNFIDRHPRRDYWYSYLNWKDNTKGLYYFEDSLKFRLIGESNVWSINNSNQNFNPIFDIQNGNAIVNDILDWLSPLRKNNINRAFAEEVLNNIKLGIFNEKKSLMRNFRNQINTLETYFEEAH